MANGFVVENKTAGIDFPVSSDIADQDNHKETVRASAISGARWMTILFFLQKALSIGANAILARLLFPRDFGLVGIAWLAIGIVSVFQFLGIGAALVHRQKKVLEAYHVAFYLSLLSGLILGAVSWLAAPLTAGYFSEPAVIPIMRLLSFNFIISAFGQIPAVILMKEMVFGRRFAIEATNTLTTGISSIVFALMGLGVYSLVYGFIIGNVLSVVLGWCLVDYRPRLSFDARIARELINYGKYALGAGLATYGLMNVDYMIVGKRLGVASLGIYTMGFTTISFSYMFVTFVANRVAFPTFAKVQADRETLRKALRKATQLSMFVSLPIMMFLIVMAPQVVHFVYGEKWMAAVPVMQYLLLFVLLRQFTAIYDEFFKAVGRPDLLLKINIIWLILLAPSMVWGARYGLVGISITHSLVAIPVLATYVLTVSRLSEMSLGDLLNPLKPIAIGLGLSLTSILIVIRISVASPSVVVTTLSITVVGALAYLGGIALTDKNLLASSFRYLFKKA